MAGFGGWPHRPAGRTASPAALRYAPAVSRRTPVAAWMRRRVQPSCPRAMTCCFFVSLKRLAMRRRDHGPRRRVNVLSAYLLWPVFSCPSMAGFGCPPRRETVGRQVEVLFQILRKLGEVLVDDDTAELPKGVSLDEVNQVS